MRIKTRVICGIISAVLIGISYWIVLPALNFASPGFWAFVIFSMVLVLVITTIPKLVGIQVKNNALILPPRSFGFAKKMLLVIAGLIVVAIVATLVGATVFNSGKYKDLLKRETGDFATDVAELSMNQIPVVDRDSAIQLGKRKLGQMSDLVSQFEISTDYTQINYKNKPMRVTPLEYASFIKWFTNNKQGIPGYIQLDMVTQDTTLVRLDQGMKYAPCEYFGRDLLRFLRFQYLTKIFNGFSFEIDDEGTPYWIASTMCYRVGLWGGMDVEGAVLVNAITGENKYYPVESIPTWVDRVYDAHMVVEQLNWNGQFQSGFWNAHIGQKGVLHVTEGYNYIAANDDVYLYTGMTSVTGDQSNVGFVLVNMRTKDTKFYEVPGAEEYSAMGSAEGQVQHLGYSSTFPLLLNIANRPTYFMSLKDAAGLVKMYAFVDVERYQLVGTGNSVPEARTNYEKILKQEEGVAVGGKPHVGVIAAVTSAVVEGNTRYYFQLEGDDTIYISAISISNRLPFYKIGDTITITFAGDGETKEIISIK